MHTEKVEIRPGRSLFLTVNEVPNPKGTIFLIHGVGGRSAQWREQIPLLQKNYRLIIPDLLGHGKSAQPKGNKNYSAPELLQDLQVLFDQFAGDHNMIFGHSYGGELAVLLALKNATRIQKLVLISPVAVDQIPAIPKIYLLPSALLEWMRAFLAKAFLSIGFDRSASPQLLETEYQAIKNNHIYIVKAVLEGMKGIPTTTDIQSLQIPVLIIMGASDQLVPIQQIKTCYQRLPQVQMETIANAGHMVLLEKPQEVNQLILKFIA